MKWFFTISLLFVSSSGIAAQLYKCPTADGGNAYVQKKMSSACVVVKNAAPPPSNPYIPDVSASSGNNVSRQISVPAFQSSQPEALPPAPPFFAPPTALPPPETQPSRLPPLPPGLSFP